VSREACRFQCGRLSVALLELLPSPYLPLIQRTDPSPHPSPQLCLLFTHLLYLASGDITSSAVQSQRSRCFIDSFKTSEGQRKTLADNSAVYIRRSY